MRGEYPAHAPFSQPVIGSPPHARRIHKFQLVRHLDLGITSACAENTMGYLETSQPTEDHLRMRGEYRNASR